MIELDMSELSYDNLREAMLNHKDINGLSFKKGGNVEVGAYIIERFRQKDIPFYDPSIYEFRTIGVRP